MGDQLVPLGLVCVVLLQLLQVSLHWNWPPLDKYSEILVNLFHWLWEYPNTFGFCTSWNFSLRVPNILLIQPLPSRVTNICSSIFSVRTVCRMYSVSRTDKWAKNSSYHWEQCSDCFIYRNYISNDIFLRCLFEIENWNWIEKYFFSFLYFCREILALSNPQKHQHFNTNSEGSTCCNTVVVPIEREFVVDWGLPIRPWACDLHLVRILPAIAVHDRPPRTYLSNHLQHICRDNGRVIGRDGFEGLSEW